MKNIAIFVFGGVMGSILLILLTISGIVKLVSSNDVNLSFDLPKKDIPRMADEARAPSVEGIQLSNTEAQAFFICPAATAETCKVEYKFPKKD